MPSAITSVLSAVFSVATYAYAFSVFLWLAAFLLPAQVLPDLILNSIPQTLDSAPVWEGNTGAAVALDLLLLAIFAVPHSVLARPQVKKFMNFSPSFERPFYIFQTAVCLHVQMKFWRNFDGGKLWDVTDNETNTQTLIVCYICGFLFLLSATFALDHFHLFGLTQGLGIDLNKIVGLAAPEAVKEGNQDSTTGLVSRWHYRIVAHPIMTGMLVMLWFTPKMTYPRLVYALVYTFYILIAVIRFEEPDLTTSIGPAYTKYLSTVPRFIPCCHGPRGHMKSAIGKEY